MMRGIGDILSAPVALPKLGIIIVHPGVAMPTPPVFAGAGPAPRRAAAPPARSPRPCRTSARHCWRWLAAERNDLEAPAISIAPAIAEVLAHDRRAAGMPARPHVRLGLGLLRPVRHEGAAATASRPSRRSAGRLVGAGEQHRRVICRSGARSFDPRMHQHLAHQARKRRACDIAGRRSSACRRARQRPPGPRARYTSELQRKMGEHMGHHPRKAPPAALPAPRAPAPEALALQRAPPPRRNRRGTPSSAPRSCRRAGPSPDGSAPGDGRRHAAPRRRRRGAAVPSRFFALRGNVSGSPRRRAAQASMNGHSAQAGFFGVQMVAPRSIIAWAKSPGRCGGRNRSASTRIAGLASGSSSSTA